jgi:hypothetical protein
LQLGTFRECFEMIAPVRVTSAASRTVF